MGGGSFDFTDCTLIQQDKNKLRTGKYCSIRIPNVTSLYIYIKAYFFYFNFSESPLPFNNSFALRVVTTFLPVLASSSFLATLATFPPCLATFLLCSKSFGFTA